MTLVRRRLPLGTETNHALGGKNGKTQGPRPKVTQKLFKEKTGREKGATPNANSNFGGGTQGGRGLKERLVSLRTNKGGVETTKRKKNVVWATIAADTGEQARIKVKCSHWNGQGTAPQFWVIKKTRRGKTVCYQAA